MADKTIAIEIKVEGLDNVKLSTSELDKLAQQRAKNKRESTEVAKAIQAEEGSMAKLRAETSLLVQKMNQLNLTTKEGQEQAKKYQAQIVANKEKIRDFDRQLSGSTTLVGEYERGFSGAFKKIGVGMLAVSGIIAGVVGAFRGLNSAIQSSETLSESFERRLGGLGASFGVLRGKVTEFFEELLSKNDKKSINWGNGLRDVLGFISMGLSELVPGVRKLGDEMNAASKANEDIIRKQQDLADLEGDRIEQRAKANNELAKAKLLAESETASQKEKITALQTAIGIEQKILTDEIEYQKSVIQNQKELNELKKLEGSYDTGKEGLALKQAEAKLLDLQTESYLKQRKALSALNKEKELYDKQQRQADLESMGGSVTAIKSGGVTGNIKVESEKAFNEFRKKESKKTTDFIKKSEIESLEEIKQKRTEIYQASFNEIGGILSSYSSLVEANKQRELSAAGDNAKKREQIEREYAKKQQQIAIAQAISGVALAVINAMQTKPYIPLGLIASIAAGIKGGIEIATIKSQKFATGGLLIGPSHNQGGIPLTVNGRPGYEAEGGEAIINKRSTAKYKSLLSKINQEGGGKKFALGGILPEQSNAIGFDLVAMSNMIARQINSIQVINSVGEFHKANAIYTDINTRSVV